MKRNRWITALLLASLIPVAQSAFAADTVVPASAIAKGSTVFHNTCIACHGADGKGVLPGMPDFTQPHGVLSLPETVLENRITNGFSSGNAPMPMPPKGGNSSLTPSDVKDVIAYLRTTFEQ